MGAWGHTTFKNDAALDWLANLAEGDAALLATTLGAVADAHEGACIDVDDACAALVAAELFAAAAGMGDERLNDSALQWLDDHRDMVRKLDVACVRRAVERVLKNSELQQLWEEGGTDTEWHHDVRELLTRVSAQQDVQPSSPAPSTPKPKRRRKIRINAGDVFELPLPNGKLGYGQVLSLPLLLGYFLLERSTRPTIEEIVHSPVAFRVKSMTDTLKDGSWPMLGNAPLSEAMAAPLRIAYGNPGFMELYEWSAKEGGTLVRVSDDAVRGLEKAGIWDTRTIPRRLEAALRGEPCPWVEIA